MSPVGKIESLIERLRSARCIDVDTYVAHVLHDAEAALLDLEADNARLIGANLALQERVESCACPDCGGKGGTAPNGVHYCNCEDD